MNIRELTEEDYPRIFEIYSKSKLDELRFEKKTFKLLPLEDDEKRLSALKESKIYVFDDGNILGFGAIFGSEIRALFVCPSARGNGIGRKILEFLLSQICGKANLFVAKTNEPAKELYKAYGFEVSDEFLTEYNGESVYANEMVRIKGQY
ncbi:GNAT family N-acetyltransferase [Pseudoalteromonas maricaloris]|uniref:GNAT family N-acetyltransferase n=1 Tax=Pseudoalteromonas maricaloris TaxID=184924 RepID=A0A8I2H2Z3_9GAMM|nr:GNAT family N-acetyltransferase [Pseudoalteromonas maricaloris]NLR22166.1 GNAT family N-acetyltransferase [Pseudoalteromonas maricaloris]WOX31473.1 GNAT family N-acetyltransferase [Pseudoalteromonas maricaloris]